MDKSSCQVLDNSWIRWKCWLFPFTSDSASWHVGIFAIINGSALIANVPLRYCFYGGHDRMSLSCSYGLWLEVAGCNLARSGNHSLGWGVNALLYGSYINSVRWMHSVLTDTSHPNATKILLSEQWGLVATCFVFQEQFLHIVMTKQNGEKWKAWYFVKRKYIFVKETESITIWVKFSIAND